MKPKKIILFVLFILMLLAGLGYFFFYYLPQNGRDEIRVSGHVEVTEVDLSFRLAGHVDKLLADEGDQVKKGQLLAELEQTKLVLNLDQARARLQEIEAAIASLKLAVKIRQEVLSAEVDRAAAGREAAQARYKSLKTGSREEEIQEAAAARDRAYTYWRNQAANYRRLKELYNNNSISASQYDDARAASESARSAYVAADEQFKLVKAGPRQEAVDEGQAQLSGSEASLEAAQAARREVEKMKLDLKGLEAQAKQAGAALAMAQDDLAHSRILAPFDGFITVKDVEEKEYIQPGTPVLTIARLDEVWVKTFLPETRLGKLRLGQKALVTSDTFPDKTYPGTVTYISPEAEFTPKNVQTREERIKLVYRFKVTLKNPRQELKAGMPVDVEVR